MTCLVKAQQNRQVHFGGYGEPCAAGAVALGLAWNPRVYNFRAVATVQVLREVLVALLDPLRQLCLVHVPADVPSSYRQGSSLYLGGSRQGSLQQPDNGSKKATDLGIAVLKSSEIHHTP